MVPVLVAVTWLLRAAFCLSLASWALHEGSRHLFHGVSAPLVGISTRVLLLPTTVCSTLCCEIGNYVRRLLREYTEMKITARLSIVIGLVLAFSFAGLAGSSAAPAPGDKNSAPLDQQQMRGLDEQVQEVKSDVL